MSLVLTAALLLGQGAGDVRLTRTSLAPLDGKDSRLQTYWKEAPTDRTKLSPKKFPPTNEPYSFDWVLAGLVKPKGDPERWNLRFRLYAQIKPTGIADPNHGALRTLLRLWEINEVWGIDHTPQVPDQIVDVYLCWGGKPGGEQLFDNDPQVLDGQRQFVNTIYIYDLPSFKGPVEQIREVAHEYGHATLPAIGGYSAPEDWANGFIGERIYMARLRDLLNAGKIPPVELFGVDPKELDVWVAANVDVPAKRAASEGPFAPSFSGREKAGMEALVGQFAHLQHALPTKTFARTLKLIDDKSAFTLIRAAANAVGEVPMMKIKVPMGVPVWIPTGLGKITGGAVLAKRAGWSRVKATGAEVTLRTVVK